MNYSDCILFGILFVALIMDYKSSKIPNLLILFGYGLGVVLLFFSREELWYFYLIDSIYILAIGYVLYIGGVFGGGDAKLFAVIALWLGFEQTLMAGVIAVIAGFICSVFKIIDLIRKKEFQKENFSHLTIHFALPIFVGALISEVIVWNRFWQF
ncbi:MAG: prepilin peptidase [Lachnospiraceae bacterium]|nr:prepilin peptidase [Lachnospiraceae bacterium]